jgi:hypothetical protein
MNDNDSTANDTLSTERNTPFVFMLVYEPDSLGEQPTGGSSATAENQLLYELARYNFTNYLVRNFDIQVEQDGELHRMSVSGFLSYDEARQYARKLYADTESSPLLRRCRSLLISEQNLARLGTRMSYDDYETFFEQIFKPMEVSDEQLLNIPEHVEQPDTDDEEDGVEEEDEDGGNDSSTDFGEDFW